MSEHQHRFRRFERWFRVPGWLGHPGEPFTVLVYLCRCGETGYPVKEENRGS